MLSSAALLLAAACAVLAGGTSPPKGASPHGAATQTGPDLTNQASPLASTYHDGRSYTPLASPPAVVGLEQVVSGLSAPMMLTEPDDGSGRLFIIDQIRARVDTRTRRRARREAVPRPPGLACAVEPTL